MSRKELQLQPGGEHVVDGVTYHESERGHAGYTTEGTTGLPAGGDMNFVDYANPDETELLTFERWAPDMPWEVSTGNCVPSGELTVYPAPPEHFGYGSRCDRADLAQEFSTGLPSSSQFAATFLLG